MGPVITQATRATKIPAMARPWIWTRKQQLESRCHHGLRWQHIICLSVPQCHQDEWRRDGEAKLAEESEGVFLACLVCLLRAIASLFVLKWKWYSLFFLFSFLFVIFFFFLNLYLVFCCIVFLEVMLQVWVTDVAGLGDGWDWGAWWEIPKGSIQNIMVLKKIKLFYSL